MAVNYVPPPGPTKDSTTFALAVVSLCATIIAAALAFLPVGPAAVVCGGIGVATGAVTLLRARAAGSEPLIAVAALTASAVATALAIVMLFASHLPPRPVLTAPASQPSAQSVELDPKVIVNTDTPDVLAHELQIDFGDVTVGPSGQPVLNLTATNKMDVARSFSFSVGAFVGGAQIAVDQGIDIKLGPHARQEIAARDIRGASASVDRLRSAEFKVLEARSRFFGI